MTTQEDTKEWMSATEQTAASEAESHREAVITSIKAMDGESTPLEEALTEIEDELVSVNAL